MNELVVYVLGGIVTGLAGGYLGVGGGTILIPYLTLIAGMDISRAVPISLAAVVMNSIAGSTDYLKKAMVDMELAVVLAIFLVMGNIAGSLIHSFLPMGFVQGLFSVMLVYTGITMLRGRKESITLEFGHARTRGLLISIPLTFLVGALGGLIGLGGAEFLIPLFFLVIGVPLATARGTASFMVGFSAAAALAVYYFRDAVDIHAVAPVVVGIILGGKIGGLLGSRAKPMAVRVLFSGLLFYLAYRLGWKSWENFM